jgi:hypothetical protein
LASFDDRGKLNGFWSGAQGEADCGFGVIHRGEGVVLDLLIKLLIEGDRSNWCQHPSLIVAHCG